MTDSEPAGTSHRGRWIEFTHRVPRVVGVLVALVVAACDPEPDKCPADMPDNWNCPDALDISAAPPNCDQGAEMPSVALSDDGAFLQVAGVIFRTGEDDVCAWGTVDGAILDVLVQPCEMHPSEDSLKGFCYHDFSIALPSELSEIARVDVFTRYDFLGYMPPEEPLLMEHGTVLLDD